VPDAPWHRYRLAAASPSNRPAVRHRFDEDERCRMLKDATASAPAPLHFSAVTEIEANPVRTEYLRITGRQKRPAQILNVPHDSTTATSPSLH
jgi:hypothetical protein